MKKNIRFKNRLGHSLAGILHTPKIKSASLIAKTLCTNGFMVLRFDFTGLGASTGKFVETNFSSDVDDLVDAANFLNREYQAPSVLIGHSLGGTAILAAAPQITSSKAVACIGSPAYPEHILHLLESKLETIAESGEADVDIGPQKLTFNQGFIDDVRSYKTDYKNLDKALMVLHSPIDKTVSVEQAEIIFDQAMHPKSYVSLDDADHLLTDSDDAIYVAGVIAKWCSRYLRNDKRPAK